MADKAELEERVVMERTEIVGYVILSLGAALLVFTFLSAYLFLRGVTEILTPPDLMEVFGEALAPLIETCIHAIYLAVMGWIGSTLTMRGIQILRQVGAETEAGAKAKTKEAKSSK